MLPSYTVEQINWLVSIWWEHWSLKVNIEARVFVAARVLVEVLTLYCNNKQVILEPNFFIYSNVCLETNKSSSCAWFAPVLGNHDSTKTSKQKNNIAL